MTRKDTVDNLSLEVAHQLAESLEQVIQANIKLVHDAAQLNTAQDISRWDIELLETLTHTAADRFQRQMRKLLNLQVARGIALEVEVEVAGTECCALCQLNMRTRLNHMIDALVEEHTIDE